MEGPDIRIAWKDADSLIASWFLSNSTKRQIEDRFAIPLGELPFVLRLYDVTERAVQNDGHDHYVDFTINLQAQEWILYGIEPKRSYCVDLGVRMVDGRFYSLKRSDII